MKTLLRSTPFFAQFPLPAIALLLAVWVPVAAQAEPAWQESRTGMVFLPLAKGCYAMGLADDSEAHEEGHLYAGRVRHETPAHQVCLDAFWIGRFEVTEGQWRTLMGPPARPLGDDRPMTGMAWDEAVAFAERLTREAGNGDRFRLPTEAEWEFACRAGAPVSGRPPYGDQIADQAWFAHNYDSPDGGRVFFPQPVGSKKPNPAGLHDMLGNVWEWVQDGYRDDAYRLHVRDNPQVNTADSRHGLRGGSVRTARHLVRCSARGWQAADVRADNVGFRLVRIPGATR